MAFREYFLLAPDPVDFTSFASTKEAAIVVTCSGFSFANSAVFETVEPGLSARVSRTKRAFGSAIALKISVMIVYLSQLPGPRLHRSLQ